MVFPRRLDQGWTVLRTIEENIFKLPGSRVGNR